MGHQLAILYAYLLMGLGIGTICKGLGYGPELAIGVGVLLVCTIALVRLRFKKKNG